jgi:hypothetical protein
MQVRVAARVGALVALFLSIALAIAGAVQYSRFEDGFVSLLRSRFGAVVFDLRESVEAGLDLGLGLDALRNVQDLLDREKSRDSNILSIEAFDQTGSVVFSTDRTFIGDLIANRWMSAWKGAGTELWFVQEEDALVVGGPLVNSFDAVVGGIALRYSRVFLDKVLGNTAIALLKVTGILIVIAALGGVVGVFLFFRPVNAELDQLAAELDGLSSISLKDGATSVQDAPIETSKTTLARPPLLAETFQFSDRVREARLAIEQTSEEIRQLDELN